MQGELTTGNEQLIHAQAKGFVTQSILQDQNTTQGTGKSPKRKLFHAVSQQTLSQAQLARIIKKCSVCAKEAMPIKEALIPNSLPK